MRLKYFGSALVAIVLAHLGTSFVVDGYCQTWIGQWDILCWIFTLEGVSLSASLALAAWVLITDPGRKPIKVS